MVAIPRAPGKAFIESQMVDTCTITRDVRGVYDDVLNEATGELVASGTADTSVYAGVCVVSSVNQGDKVQKSADMAKEYNQYRVLVPLSAATGGIRIGDTLTITASVSSLGLVDKSFRVSKVETETHALYTLIRIEEANSAIGTPLI